jgi:enoyl-CoA hydratase/carnithine racemase
MSEHVRVEKSGGVLAITLARPERRNAITIAMYAALAEAVESAAHDDSVRLITFQGEGQDFAAGNDLADFLLFGDTILNSGSQPEGESHDRPDELSIVSPKKRRDGTDIPVWRLLRALATCETPIVAAVQGNCVGIGTTMLLHCDLVIAEEGARFSLPFVDLALVPEAASSLLLPRLAGRRRAARYLLLGEAFGVAEAMEIGLVSHRSKPGQLTETTAEVVVRLLAKPAGALRQTQRLLRTGEREEILERMRLEGEVFAKRLASTEAKDAISAFFERKKPGSAP